MGRLIEIDIKQNQSRPIFEIETETGLAKCILDTGAELPVWCADESLFKASFPSAEPTIFATYISGFGKGVTYANVWSIPQIVFTDRNHKDQFIIHNVLTAVSSKKKFAFIFIMSATMFLNVDYTVVNRSSSRFLRFKYDRDSYCVPKAIPNSPISKDGRQILSGITVFTQHK